MNNLSLIMRIYPHMTVYRHVYFTLTNFTSYMKMNLLWLKINVNHFDVIGKISAHECDLPTSVFLTYPSINH